MIEHFEKLALSWSIELKKPKIELFGRNIQLKDIFNLLDFAKEQKAEIVVIMLNSYLLNKAKFYKKIVKHSLETGISVQIMINNERKALNPRGFEVGCFL